MFNIDELASSLIKSGRFREAIPVFSETIDEAHGARVITHPELISLYEGFCMLLLVPDAESAANFAGRLQRLELRIPGKIPTITEEEFQKNVKDSRVSK